jgi:phosphate/sulfate permease
VVGVKAPRSYSTSIRRAALLFDQFVSGLLYRIATAWLLTLPVTILVAGGLYYLLAAPNF